VPLLGVVVALVVYCSAMNFYLTRTYTVLGFDPQAWSNRQIRNIKARGMGPSFGVVIILPAISP
jgi:hypothetical protein